MKCPVCERLDQKSKVYVPIDGVTTDMAWQPYYDEEGVYHSHDWNSHSEEWSCSQGHHWIVSGKPKCPNCDYGGYKVTINQDNK